MIACSTNVERYQRWILKHLAKMEESPEALQLMQQIFALDAINRRVVLET
jgi:hypothetical protein